VKLLAVCLFVAESELQTIKLYLLNDFPPHFYDFPNDKSQQSSMDVPVQHVCF